MYRLMKYGIIACVALVIGSTLLATVADYVIIMRNGNLTPLIGLIIVSTILVHYSERFDPEKRLMKIMLGVFAGQVSLLLFMVVFLWTYFMFGIIPGVVATFLTLIYLNLVRNPNVVRDYWEHMLLTSSNFSHLTNSDGARLSYRAVKDFSVYIVPREKFDSFIEIFTARPQLPMVLIRYEEMNILYIKHDDHKTSIDAILGLLGLEDVKKASPLLSRVIVTLPILEETYGIKLSDYVLVEDQLVVKRILDSRPTRMSVIPHNEGPRLVVLNKDALGMNVREIPVEHRTRVIVSKDIGVIKSKNNEEVPTIAS
jgi:hypothetical protein